MDNIITSTEKRLITERIRASFKRYHSPEFLGLDPLVTLVPFSQPRDVEIAALIAAILAYGRVEIIIRNIRDLFSRMKMSPYSFVTSTTYREKKRLFANFKHRFNSGDDIALFLQACAEIIEEHGTIEGFFSAHVADGIKSGISSLSRTLEQKATHISPVKPLRSFSFLTPDPESGSACKRMNMFLRWMVRPADGIDLGIWESIKPSQLIIPVDTHVASIARKEGITLRKQADWRMAEEITAFLRTIDPLDPVRFDFSLCRIGMVNLRKAAA